MLPAPNHPPSHCRRPPLQARKGEADSTPDDIMAMVKAQCAPPHRLILFLQQSSVEWCSSLWMHIIQEVDPHYQRTIMVCSKFDNRLKVGMQRMPGQS